MFNPVKTSIRNTYEGNLSPNYDLKEKCVPMSTDSSKSWGKGTFPLNQDKKTDKNEMQIIPEIDGFTIINRRPNC